MSAEDFTTVLQRAAADPGFRARAGDRKAQALKGFDLTADEKTAVRSLLAAAPERWQRPTFKELGAAVLSVVLVLICVPVIIAVIAQIGSEPTGVKVGEATLVVDAYDRAKQLLGIVFPLLTATVTFWLGVAVEGRRADANGKAAADANGERDAAKDERDEATRREHSARTTAVDVITELETALGVPTTGPRAGAPELRGGPPVPAPDLDHLRGVVRAAKTRLLD